jgi:transposase-like protein
MLRLLCPKCKNSMNYEGRGGIVVGKKKRCVYCGKTFGVREHILKRLD